jgi:hypothetical protein
LEARFAPPLARVEAKLVTLHDELDDLRDRAALFTRKFGAELDAAYARLKPLEAEIAEGFAEKEAPRRRLQDAKDYLDHWHSRADSSLPFYGMKGKSIARHNLFGISTAKKDRAIAAKQDAIRELKNIDAWLTPLRIERDELKARIRVIKAARASFKQLCADRVTPADARRDVTDAEARLKAQEANRSAIAALRQRFETSSPLAKRIQRIDQEIDKRLAAKKAAFAAFWEPEARADRQLRFDAMRAGGANWPKE